MASLASKRNPACPCGVPGKSLILSHNAKAIRGGGFQVASPVKKPRASEMPRCAPPHTFGAGEEPCQGGGHVIGQGGGNVNWLMLSKLNPPVPGGECRKYHRQRYLRREPPLASATVRCVKCASVKSERRKLEKHFLTADGPSERTATEHGGRPIRAPTAFRRRRRARSGPKRLI